MSERHFHFIETALLGGLGAIALIHAFRYFGAKLIETRTGVGDLTGRALVGAGTFS